MDGARISVVIPTKDGGRGFEHLCRHLAAQRDRFELDILVIDSGSRDGTAEAAARWDLRVRRIEPADFGHGCTRNLGVRETTGEVVCFLTQDVLPCTPNWPARFAQALAQPGVAGVYGRQVPRDAATMEMFFVAMNYPELPHRYGREDVHPQPGRVVFSNAFSAIRRDVWASVPFPEDVAVSEDQAWAQAVLARGYTIVYEPEVEALHAHRHSLRSLFRRHYVLARSLRSRGLDAAWRPWSAARVLAAEIDYFVHHGHVTRLPQLVVYELVRWLGIQAGRWSARGWARGDAG